jgi:nucleotide-binding universal stress UspA family protein
MKFLLAVDGSPCSLAAVDEIARRAWAPGSEVKILSAIEMRLEPLAEPWLLPHDEARVLKAQREQALNIVSAAAAKLRAASRSRLRVTTKVEQGSPKEVILDTAERWGAALIVVGSHGALSRFLLGSVSHAVALHAKCSVGIVRHHVRKTSKRTPRFS